MPGTPPPSRYLSTQMEEFSHAFIAAVAAAADCILGNWSQDRDSIDTTIRWNHPLTPRIDLQLKSTANPVGEALAFPFDLRRKNYDDLRVPRENLGVPRLLVVVALPQDQAFWLDEGSPTGITLRYRAYWLDLAGQAPTDNIETVRLQIPKAQLFTVAEVRRRMADIVRETA